MNKTPLKQEFDAIDKKIKEQLGDRKYIFLLTVDTGNQNIITNYAGHNMNLDSDGFNKVKNILGAFVQTSNNILKGVYGELLPAVEVKNENKEMYK